MRRDVNDDVAVIRSLQAMAHTALGLDDTSSVGSAAAEALTTAGKLGDSWVTPLLDPAAALAAATEQPTRALRLSGAAEALREKLGAPLAADRRANNDHPLAPVRSALTTSAATAAREEGRAMPIEHVIAEALGWDVT